MIVKNIGTPGRILRLLFGLVCLALAFLPTWHGVGSVVLLALGVLGILESVVCM